MTDQEILQKAIKKASYNGYSGIVKCDYFLHGSVIFTQSELKKIRTPLPYQVIIFSHDFAKAFWGTDEVKNGKSWQHVFYKEGQTFTEDLDKTSPAWQYHLQQMVLEENPIKYLKVFL